LYQQHGYLNAEVINQAPDLPQASYIARHFGSLLAAYSQLRFKSRVSYSHATLIRRLDAARMNLGVELTRQMTALGAVARWEKKGRLLHINEELHVYVVFVRSMVTNLGSLRWYARLRPELQADMTLMVRMDARNETIRDYYLLPRLDAHWVYD